MKRSDRRSSRGKNGDDTGWVRLKLPIATDPGQIQYAVDMVFYLVSAAGA
jgi:hypothetical protein